MRNNPYPERKKIKTDGISHKQKQTIVLVDRGGVEDSRINRAIFGVNVNTHPNDAHGGKQQGVTESRRRRRGVISDFSFLPQLPLSAGHWIRGQNVWN